MDTDNSEVPENSDSNWKKISLNTMDIRLDNENPRLNLNPDANQEDIRKALFEQEDILELIDSITENGGLFPGETIIVLKNNDHYKVLEGNRRVCSLQCMINPELAPQDYRKNIKTLITDFNIEKIKTIEASIAPTWEAAQKIITSRHTEYQIKKWSYIPKWRRDYKEFLKTKNAQNVSDTFSEDLNKVIKNLNNFAYMRYILDMPTWNSDERSKLSSNDLKGSLLEREMSPEIQKVLGISIDQTNYDLHFTMNKEKFDCVLTKFIRSLFLGFQPNISTRTDKETVKSYVNAWIKEYDNTHPNKKNEKASPETHIQERNTDKSNKEQDNNRTQTKKSNGKKPGPRSSYFKSLKVADDLNDENLGEVAYEISKISVKNFPLATLLLTRTLIERSLIYRLRDKDDMWSKFLSEMKTKYGENKYLYAFKLDDIVRYCIKNTNDLFKDPKVAVDAKKSLETINSPLIRGYLNDIAHVSLKSPSEDYVQNIADSIKVLIQKILLKEE